MNCFLFVIGFIAVILIIIISNKIEENRKRLRTFIYDSKSEWVIFPKHGIKKSRRYTITNFNSLGYSTYRYFIENEKVILKLIECRHIDESGINFYVKNGIFQITKEDFLKHQIIGGKEIWQILEEEIIGIELSDLPLKHFILNTK